MLKKQKWYSLGSYCKNCGCSTWYRPNSARKFQQWPSTL